MRKARHTAEVLVVLLVLLAVACGGATTPTAVVETVPAAEAADVLATNDAAVLLDIRTPEEYADGHIVDSLNIDFYEADFADRIGELDRDTTYVVYCRSGNRSGAAMDLFRDLGFADVNDVDGGIVAWVEAGLPVVR